MKQKKPWYISVREHAIDPLFRSSAPGSIGRIFSSITFSMCCYYWMGPTGTHEAPASLLQVFYWTTGYVFANTVVRTASGHITEKIAAVPAIPGIDQLAGTQKVTRPGVPTVTPGVAPVASKTSTVVPVVKDTTEESDCG